jgi:lipid II:glycine glycyltransferase (peptidoglycan interpeptide bridge formation enzyme)
VRVAVVYASDGKPAAAGIILLHPKTVANPWASSLSCYDRWKPNMLLYWTFLAFAADNGFNYFDFGRSTPGEGTWRFKEQWGAVSQPLFWYEMKETGKNIHPPNNSMGSTRNRQSAAALWRKLPAVATNCLGPRIRKYISL